MKTLYIGLMSGTSMDGVDAVLARLDDTDDSVQLLGHRHAPFDSALQQTLTNLNKPAFNELHSAAIAANALAIAYAEVVHDLLQATGNQPSAIQAIGAHGQTVRHRPGDFDATGYTIQLLNGARLAELVGIDVVCDFRSRDVAAGGQGAPLVPAFHKAVFCRPGTTIAVLNIGGIANLTLLNGDGSVGGFDCGPGNVFLDMWCQRHLGAAYDASGAWSASGTVDQLLLNRLLTDPYFRKPLPKSTGRDLFNMQWLDRHLDTGYSPAHRNPADIQATLAELTAQTAAAGLTKYLPGARQLLVCGGGAFNLDLLGRLKNHLAGTSVASTQDVGVDPMQVEAAAFAWLAKRFVDRQSGNCPEVTGASGHRILGSLHPA